MTDDVLLSLDGPKGGMSAGQFLGSARSLLRLLDCASPDRIAWQISTLELGSLRLGLSAPQDAREVGRDAADTVVRGLRSLESTAAIPHGYSIAMVKDAQQLASTLGKGGITGVSVTALETVVRIDEALASNAASAVAGKYVSIGSVQGTLDKVNLRDTREFGLIDESTGVSMTCAFGPDLDAIVKQSIDTPVVVTGQLSRNAVGQKVRMKAWSVEPLAKRPPQPIEQLVGVLGADWTGGLDSVEFVRLQRG